MLLSNCASECILNNAHLITTNLAGMEPADEPHVSAPAPSPHPSSELLESGDLEITPEKPHGRRRRMRMGLGKREGGTCSSSSQLQFEDASTIPAPPLSIPGINSTARLYHKLQSLKQQRHNRPAAAATSPTDRREGFSSSPSPSPPPPTLASSSPVPGGHRVETSGGSAGYLEGAVVPKPLREVNVPRHFSRYSDLVSVDVSEESFQRMTVKSRKGGREYGGRRRRGGRGGSQSEEPSVMEFFAVEMEWEEAEWTVGPRAGGSEPLEPVDAPGDAAFMLYRCMYAQIKN